MADVSWTLNTASGDVTADRVVGQPTTVTRGTTQRITVGFDTSSPYTTIRDLLEYSADVSTFDGQGTDYYRETHGQGDTLLVGFNPDGADQPSEVLGFWAVVTGGSDAVNAVYTRHRVELQVYILAKYSAHADRSAAKTAHER